MRAIIFDLDGVIVSTDDYHYLAWKKIADKLNIPFHEEANHRLRGVSRMESLEIILRDGNVELSENEKLLLAEEKNDIYRQMLNQLSPEGLDAEVLVSLHTLRKRGWKLAIGSSSKNARAILSRIGLENEFDAIADGTMIRNSKPDPEVFLMASQALAVNPEDCFVVEDAWAGILAGKRAGMKTIAVGDARNSSEADHKVNTFAEILKIVEDPK